jgi:hypothetical protein
MTEATQQGAPVKQKAFPHPETLDNSPENSDDRVNPRDAIMEAMDARIDEQRKAEMAELELPPSEESPFDEAQLRKEAQEEQEGLELEPGLQTQERMHEPEPEEKALPKELQDDPLAEYIVMDKNKAMFRTKVDGEDRLIPLETARATLQKHVAADIRLQQAAKERKELEAREEAIRQNEAALQAKLSSPPSVEADVSDQDLQLEARAVVNTLFTGSEDEAVESLTSLLAKTRQAKGPQVDSNELVNQAVARAKAELLAEREREALAAKQKDINSGFEKFSEDYPEIVGDVNLFRYADGMTDTIVAEHPDWAPSQVMAEAGVRTRAWIASLKGEPPAEAAPNDRHNRKRNLTPMPQSRSAVQERQAPEPVETPQSILEQMRGARGQA